MFRSSKAPIYENIPAERGNDWGWRLSNRLNPADDIGQFVHSTEIERKILQASSKLFPVNTSPYLVSPVNPENPNNPICKQAIPTSEKNSPFIVMMEDSLAEDRDSPIAGLTYRYPDQASMMVTTQGAT